MFSDYPEYGTGYPNVALKDEDRPKNGIAKVEKEEKDSVPKIKADAPVDKDN